ncbi:MAG: hypothetical protein OEO20_15490 [Gemmatimonadota bacterium]|nr:hypothetical protein [Gemmatimonadota bacterium]MDH3369147.1 hypothetical protein [Gemmatimonadota bacterium]MDH3479699.1 hypothetical protein [Gemmatimonadota bacterium]MDH3570279.1 hypothetical protein [Gemmatimonadota bacterium]MDH5549827.1 hypothetical protein [Gemmatimonadota bacterium]
MIELNHDSLRFRFPEVSERAEVHIEFQRTLRIPDDGKEYPLPAGLGRFPLRHVDDFPHRAPARWLEHGGVMLPMYQSEALWINFSGDYPFAVKVAAGKINAVTGKPWSNGLNRGPQDYVVVPEQPWLDGYCVKKGIIRQFVAMPLGAGYSAEEQITGEAEHGGIQIIAYPMKRKVYEQRFSARIADHDRGMTLGTPGLFLARGLDMGLGAGGRMRQEIYDDPFDFSDWDTDNASRCFAHLANSLMWREITGEAPPTTPLTTREYAKHGIPWFGYYADGEAVQGSKILDGIKSVFDLGKSKGEIPLPENESVVIDHVVELRKGLAKGQVREGAF